MPVNIASLAGLFFLAAACCIMTTQLAKSYPLGCGRGCWKKYVPGWGFGLLLISAGGPHWTVIPGMLVIVLGSYFHLTAPARHTHT